MKIVKSKFSIALLSVGFVGVVAGISYAALSREVRSLPSNSGETLVSTTKKDPATIKVVSGPPKAPHQAEVENYLEAMRGYLETPPRDGVFGGDRIPTLHGKESEEISAYKDVQKLEGDIKLRSAVVGLRPDKDLKEMAKIAADTGQKAKPLTPLDSIRLTDVHYVGLESEESYAATERWDADSKMIQQFAIDIRKKGVDSLTKDVMIKGVPGWIVGKAVHASVNSCYNCHANIKKGDPIGYTVALYSKAKK